MPLKTRAEKAAVKHPNKLGAGAAKRKHLGANSKVETVMHEWKHGTLHSGSGKIVPKSNKKQAIAIAMSEAGKSKKKK